MIQRYITRPLLWEGKFKFHFRVYVVLTANMQFHVYRRAFAHVANKPFVMPATTSTAPSDTSSDTAPQKTIVWDPEIHLTNVAANIHDLKLFHPYPIVDIPKEYPGFWNQIKQLFTSLVSEMLFKYFHLHSFHSLRFK